MMTRRLIHSLYHIAAGAAMLGLGGAALLPYSAKLKREENAAGLQADMPPVTGDALVEQLAFFTLGGLRSLAAEILVLDATTAWVERDWPRAESRWQMVTTLCPLRPNYWISASRDMATNAASHALHDSELTLAEQTRLSRRYFARGERFLQDAAAHLPNHVLIHKHLGDLYSDLNRFPSFARAAAAYHRAVELGAAPIYQRQEFYNLCRIRGREEEAWKLGRELFRTQNHRVPSLKCLLFVLQHKIHVAPEERLDIAELFGTEAKARKELSLFLRNNLRFPVTGIREYLSGAAPHADAPSGTPPSSAFLSRACRSES